MSSRAACRRRWGSGLTAGVSSRRPHGRQPLRPTAERGPPTCSPRSTAIGRYPMPSATASVATSIESAPMRDVRETSVEIGAVAGRPAQHLARFSEPALSSHLLGAYDASTIRFELTGQATPIHSPALVDLVGRVPGAPAERSPGSQPTTSLWRAVSYMPPVGPRMSSRCSASTRFRRATGCIFAPATRSSRRTRRCGCGPSGRRAAGRGRRP